MLSDKFDAKLSVCVNQKTSDKANTVVARRQFAVEVSNVLNARPSGIARYAQCLVAGLWALDRSEGLGYDVVQLWRLSRYKRRNLLPIGQGLSRRAWVDGLSWPAPRFDVVHATSHRLPRWPAGAKVVTIHDVYAALGINYQDDDGRRRQVGIYRDLAARADHVICVSENTRKDFLAHFDFPADRASVIHHGIGEELRPRTPDDLGDLRLRYGVSRHFMLVFGSRAENKNIARLLEAYGRSAVADDFDLMLAGPMSEADKMRLQESASGTKGRVIVPGYVPNADVPLLYAAASAFLFPSTYEGFGLPILEAMACGTPVLTSTGGACPEVAAGHAVLVDPFSVDDIVRGLDEVVRMSAAQRDAALAYSRSKTWEATARQTLQVYQHAMAHRRS